MNSISLVSFHNHNLCKTVPKGVRHGNRLALASDVIGVTKTLDLKLSSSDPIQLKTESANGVLLKTVGFKSLGAKLFYLMTVMVLITVSGNSWQFFRTYKADLLEQLQDSLQNQAERAKDQIETLIETWRAQITVALPTLRTQGTDDGKAGNLALQRFVNSNTDFVAVHLISAPSASSGELNLVGEAFTSRINDKNFEDKEARLVSEQLRAAIPAWLKTQVGSVKGKVVVESLAKQIRLPLVTLAIRFDIANTSDVLWAVLTAWQTGINKALSKSTFLKSSVLDRSGRVFTSLDPNDVLNRPLFTGKQLLKSAMASNKPSGFEHVYKDQKNREKVGAYARFQKYPLLLVIEQDANAATQTVRRTLISTSLWASLFVLLAIMLSFLGSSQITKGLRAVTLATTKIASGDFQHKVSTGSHDEVGALATAVNHMSSQIENLLKSQVAQAQVEKDLETAKTVQNTFFPESDIRLSYIKATGFYKPATQCGGDLWGHFPIEDGIDFIFIADAMGHGVAAALVTAMAYSITMSIADIVKHDPSFRDSPGTVLERLNRVIYDAVEGKISMTFFASVIDTKRGIMTYANAGHNFPVIVPIDPSDSRLGKPTKSQSMGGLIQPISLKLMGTPLGMDSTSQYKERTTEIAPGDKIFYFTDGLIECTSPSGEMMGRKQMLIDVATYASLPAEEMKNAIVDKAFKFYAGTPQADDITLVVTEISKDWRRGEIPSATLTETIGENSPRQDNEVVAPVISAKHPEIAAISTEVPPIALVDANRAIESINVAINEMEVQVPVVKDPGPMNVPPPPLLLPPPPKLPDLTAFSDGQVMETAAEEPLASIQPASAPVKRPISNKYKLKLPSVG